MLYSSCNIQLCTWYDIEWILTNQIKYLVKQNTIYAHNSEIGFSPNFSTYVLNFIKKVNDLKLR